MAGEYNRFVRDTRADMSRLEGEVPLTPEEMRDYQTGNFHQWKQSYRIADPKGKAVLEHELAQGRGKEFPSDAEVGFTPLALDEGAPAAPRGFQPISITPNLGNQPFNMEEAKARRDQRTSDILAERETETGSGTGVGSTPPIGYQETPTGAVTGLRTPRVGGDTERPAGSFERTMVETLGAGVGATAGGLGAGALTKNPIATMAATRSGEAGGAFLGSLLSESFDPTEKPLDTATTAAGWTAATGLAASGGAALFRKMLGKPTEAGKHILKVMEAEGKVPPPGVVLPETSIANTIQSIGSAEAFFGRSVKEHLKDTADVLNADLRSYIADFYRYKRGADKLFAEWDDVVNSLMNNPAFGNPRRVPVKLEHFDALEAAVKEWDRQGLTHMVDNNLLSVIQKIQNAKKAGWTMKDEIPLTMTEAEAARTFLFNRARAMAGTAGTEAGAIQGKDFARAYRQIADDIGGSIDDAIDLALKDGKIPVDAKAKLFGARELWKQWKQGETIMDELVIPLKAAGRSDLALRGQAIKSALTNIERQEEKLGRPLISTTQKAHLAGIERALRATEQAGKTGAFNLAVRTGQLSTLTIAAPAAAMLSGPIGVAGAVSMALSPAAFTFLVTNPHAARLLISGLRLEPGSALAARTSRELITLMAKEGFTNLERTSEQDTVE